MAGSAGRPPLGITFVLSWPTPSCVPANGLAILVSILRKIFNSAWRERATCFSMEAVWDTV
jgi:hypothetical protein